MAFVGIALFEVSLGRDTSRLMRFGLGTTFGLWMSMGMGWMWHLTVPGYLIAGCLFGVYHGLAELATPTGRWRIIGRPAAYAGRGGALLVSCWRGSARQPGHLAGRRTAGRACRSGA